MNTCPYCQAITRQNKAGVTASGSQRYRRMHCQRKYPPEPKQQADPASLRKQAIEMHLDGGNFRRIARHLKVNHQTIAFWVAQHAASLPATPVPETVQVAEMDGLFTFIGENKTQSTC